MNSLHGLAAGVMIALLAGTSFAQTCPTIPDPACGGSGQAACPNIAPGVPHTSAAALAVINAARATETPPLGPLVLPDTYTTASPDQQIIMLINAERRSRDLPALNDAADDNDPLLGYVAFNHSTLLAKVPAMWYDVTTNQFRLGSDQTAVAHNDAIDGTPGDRIGSIPVGDNTLGTMLNGSGEVIAVDASPEAVVLFWMYNDAGSAWGHRHNILNCTFQNAGAGVATSPAVMAEFGTGTIIATVDFIYSATNAYKMLSVPPGTAEPTSYRLLSLATSLDPSGSFFNIAVTGLFDPVYGVANAIKWAFIWTPAVWGQPSGALPALGVAPAGTGGVPCPITTSPPDPTVSAWIIRQNPTATTFTCTISTPFSGNPVELDVVDTFSHTLQLHYNVPPFQPPGTTFPAVPPAAD
jgi:uncharacterized protein YkwD